MYGSALSLRMMAARTGSILAIINFLTSCSHQNSDWVPGYVEGEFVYVASPLAGQLELVHVQRGQEVKTGDSLFSIESVSESVARE